MNQKDNILKQQVLAYARSLGFGRVGVGRATNLQAHGTFLERWIAQGRAAGMDYLKREPLTRADPEHRLPGARSVICLAMPYYPGESDRASGEGKVSRYAWGRDYHKLIGKRLKSLVRYMDAVAPGESCHVFLDTGPLLERAFAQQSGIGFVGKNTMLITRGLGSWVFLASVVTTLDLPEDGEDTRGCGECRLCIDACPTGAIDEPFNLDARKCLSYLTIEHDGQVDPRLRDKTEGWIYGCDVCQDVCPHNTRIPITPEPAFGSKHPAVTLREILEIKDEETFRQMFQGSAITRAGWAGLLRNACHAAVALRRSDLRPALERLDEHPEEYVREAAGWALTQLVEKSSSTVGSS